MCFFAFGFSLAYLILQLQSSKGGFLDMLANNPVHVFLVIFTFVVSWSVCGLLSLHVFLIAKNLTTHEHIRLGLLRDPAESVFSLGSVWKNCLWFLCRPQYPRYPPYDMENKDILLP